MSVTKRFRLLVGRHGEGDRRYKPGDVIETKSDLLKLNSPGSTKFALLESVPVAEPHEAKKSGKKSKKAEPVHGSATLDAMSIEELQAMAEAEEIDLGGATRKDEIIDIILEATAT